MISKEAKAYLRKQGLEMRYVIVEEHQGSQWEDVLPYETTRAWAIKKTRSNWSYLTPGEKKIAAMYLIRIVCNSDGEMIVDYGNEEWEEKFKELGIDTYDSFKPLLVLGGKEE